MALEHMKNSGIVTNESTTLNGETQSNRHISRRRTCLSVFSGRVGRLCGDRYHLFDHDDLNQGVELPYRGRIGLLTIGDTHSREDKLSR